MAKIIWITFLLNSSFYALGLSQAIQFKAFKNDVFDGSVPCLRIMEDTQGFIWFGTYQGAYRYDGAHMTAFQHNPLDSTSINHNLISTFFQDGPDIFVTTFGNGSAINKISTLDHSVRRLVIPQNKNPAHRNIIKLSNGYFLCGGDKGLIYFNLKNHASTYFPKIMANPIVQTEEGEILVSVADTLLSYRIQDSHLVLTSKTQVPGNVTSTAQIFGSRVFGTSAGMFSFDDKLEIPPQIRNTSIYCLLVDSEGNLWIGTTSDGLFRWNVSDKTLQHFKAEERDGYLHSNAIRSLYEDRNKLMWIGTSAGPFIADLSHNGISTLRLPKNSVSNTALPLYQPDLNTLWVGDATAIHSYDLKKQQYKIVFPSIRNSNTIFSNLTGDSIWVSTLGPGAFQLVRQKGGAEYTIENHYAYTVNRNNSLSSSRILTVFEDDAHAVWFGHHTSGIDILKKDGSWKYFHDSLVQGRAISSFLQANDKTIWIGKLDSGLSSCRIQKDGSYTFKHYTPENSGLKSSVVLCMAEDKDHQIWIGTMSGGLYKLDPATETFTSYAGLQGLKSTNVLNIICDNENNIWCSTSGGVAYLAHGAQKFRVFTSTDGLPQNNFSFYSSCLLMDGRIAFGSTGGIALIDPDSVFNQSAQFKPFASRILLHNKPLVPGRDSLIQVNPNLVKELTLTYEQDLLTFEFSNGYYKDPDRVIFAYFLEGYHHEWVDLGKSNVATFSRLPADHYALHVKASIDEGHTFVSMAEPIRITVLPPWWQTWWFRILAGLALVSLFYWIMRQRTQRLLAIQRIDIEKKIALEAERSRISRDMHDDLGSGLSAIHLLSNYINENAAAKYPEFSADVDKIRQSSEDLNERIREIIWTVNTKDDSLTSLVLFIRRYAHELHDKTRIPVYVHAPDPVPEIQLNGVQRKNLFLCVKESINNALKHGRPSKIDIHIYADTDKKLVLNIQDNGIGFKEPLAINQHPGNGLTNMRDRMRDIDGDAEIKSGADGTEVILKIKTW